MSLVVEASTIGLRPGHFPNDLSYKGITYMRVGNVYDPSGEELIAVRYREIFRTQNALIMEVLND